MSKSPVTTHVLDTARGRPASGVAIRLERLDDDQQAVELARGVTNEDGRITDWLPPGSLEAGSYRVTFDTGSYFEAQGQPVFYPFVSIVFALAAPDEHYHVPLLLCPFGYSTYRGS